jgi:predicted small lipoprotein YifL|tara:strand:- start:6126 stop:6257 length:132 start_codon:yes stop_codon:yes gene_type:complete
MRWLLLGFIVALQAASCGQKGPLYLPDEPQARTGGPVATAGAA